MSGPDNDYRYYKRDDEGRCCVSCLRRHERNGCTCQCHRPFNKPSEPKKSEDGEAPMLFEILAHRVEGLRKTSKGIVISKDPIKSRSSTSYFVPDYDPTQAFLLSNRRLGQRSRTPDYEMTQRRTPLPYNCPRGNVHSDYHSRDEHDRCNNNRNNYCNNNVEEYYRPKTPCPQDYSNNYDNCERRQGSPYGYRQDNGAYEW